MTVEMIEKRVLSSDGEHELAGRVYIPSCESRGLFHVVHGMVEHIARYDKFMRAMAEDGYIVFGYDNLGHGKTARDENELGYIARKDGWKRLVDDVFVYGDAMRQEYGEALPYILMGHSMGSFIVRLAALEDKHDKLIVLGSDGPRAESGMGMAFVKTSKAIKGERHVSSFAEKLAFGKYNERFGDDDPYNWLTKDEKVRSVYKQDPYCTFHFTISAMVDLVYLQRECNTKKWAEALNKTKPVLLMSGADDPVGNYGKGIEKVRKLLSDVGVPVKMKLFENCRHEILNETCYDEVVSEIRDFIED